MKRSAPVDGYDVNPQKRHYRKQVWATIRRGVVGTGIGDAHVALMPSAEGSEIGVALAAGFREKNLHVIDRNPAIVAHIKRRFPFVSTYGVELSTALMRMAERGVCLAAANLDLCGPVGMPTAEPLVVGSHARLWRDRAVVCVNTLRGRERGEWSERMAEVKSKFESQACDSDAARLVAIHACLMASTKGPGLLAKRAAYIPQPVRAEIYRSTAGNQTFLWSAWCMHRQPCQCSECGIARGEHREDRTWIGIRMLSNTSPDYLGPSRQSTERSYRTFW
jgi:hypothetical protein